MKELQSIIGIGFQLSEERDFTMRKIRIIEGILFWVIALIYIFDKNTFEYIQQIVWNNVWNNHILRFCIGVLGIFVSLTKHPEVWKCYPKWLQFILRPLSFIIGCLIIVSLIW